MTYERVPSVAEQLAAEKQTWEDVSFVGRVPIARNKFGAKSVQDPVDGRFDSTLEHMTWIDLKRRQQAGEIEGLQRQVGFSIWYRGVWLTDYIADFVFIEDGKQIVADAKGSPTREYVLKARLLFAHCGIRIREYTSDGVAPERKFRVKKKEG